MKKLNLFTFVKTFFIALFILLSLIFVGKNVPAVLAGAALITLSNPVTEMTCISGDPNCYFNSAAIISNATSYQLSSVTLWQTSPNNILNYQDYYGSWTSGMTVLPGVYDPGEPIINTQIKMVPPAIPGRYVGIFYVDGKVCTSLTNCVYYGGTAVPVVINVVVAPTPTPTPIVPQDLPSVLTTAFPVGTYLEPYKTTVLAMTPNTGEELNLTVGNLPPGLRVGKCRTTVETSGEVYKSCMIQGKPAARGVFNVVINAFDSYGGIVKEIQMMIQ